MKKYFLKITGLSTIAIPLVATIACTPDKKETKAKVIDADLIGAQNKIVDIESSKNRADLVNALDGKAKGATVTIDEIGYTEPTDLPDGVTIESDKYTLEELMDANAKKFKVKVTIKKGTGTTGKTATKVITITAKPYDFTTVKDLFVHATSAQTKTELLVVGAGGINGKGVGDTVNKNQMGYTEPTDLPDGVVASYQIKANFDAIDARDQTFEVEVTLTKGTGTTNVETATKVITITAKPYDFTTVKDLFVHATSAQTKTELLVVGAGGINGKGVGDTVNKNQMGYTEPTDLPDGVVASYQIKANFDATDARDQTFEVEVTLTKGTGTTNVETATKVITITAKPYDFTTVKGLFVNAISTKTKTELLVVGAGGINRKEVGDTVNKNQMGYTEPTDLPDGVVASYQIKANFDATDANDQTFEVTVTLTKGTGTTNVETATKVITITSQRILISELNKFNIKAISTKLKADLVEFFKSKSINNDLQTDDIGYEDLPI